MFLYLFQIFFRDRLIFSYFCYASGSKANPRRFGSWYGMLAEWSLCFYVELGGYVSSGSSLNAFNFLWAFGKQNDIDLQNLPKATTPKSWEARLHPVFVANGSLPIQYGTKTVDRATVCFREPHFLIV